TAAVEFPQEAAAGQKTIVWMTRTNNVVELKWEKEVVLPAYQKAKPDVFVKVLAILQKDIAVKREAMIAAKEPLHVWSTNWGGDGFASDRARGLIQDLTPLIQRDKLDMSDFLPDVLKIYQSEGKQWGIPFLTTGSYVYYNKKLFQAAGVPDLPTSWDDTSWTWDKYVETAKKLTKDYDNPDKAVYGTTAGLYGNLEGIPMLFGQFVWPDDAYTTGFADKVTVTDPKSVKGFQAMHDLIYKDKVAPDPATSQALDQLGGAFQSGKLAMTISGGWGHWVFKDLIDDPNGFCWGAAPLPMGSPDAKLRAVIYTDPWVITAGLDQENTDLAWDFVKFLTSKDQQAAYTKATGTPPVRASLLDDYYKSYEKCMPADKVKEVFQGAFTHGRESSNHLLVKWDQLNTTWGNDLSTFWTTPDAKAEDVLKQVETDVNADLQQIKQEEKK
ncbi:MAG TPA: extracellular solute-binding protein, partial [Roseiflexaceae bacterium]|nr:extracellular solute-binding protein [Roseiflexaceae bacterium]